MIDDLIEGGLKVIFGAIAEFFFWLIVEIFLFYSGEIILFLITLGWKKPRWDGYANERVSKFWILTDISTLIGLVFWLAILGFIGRRLLI